MNITEFLNLTTPEEKPLDNLVESYSNTSIFRKVAFIGDSLSSGEFELANPLRHYDMFEYSWGQFIARKNGMEAYNFSRGGMTAKWYMESYAEEKGFWDPDKACQAYVIALGVNDLYNLKMPVGTLTDKSESETETFAYYYDQIICKYKQISPAAKFFLVTFPKTPNIKENPVTQEMIRLLYALAEKHSNTYVIDLYQYGPVYDQAFRDRFYLNHHMNPSGYLLTARIIDSYIDYIIRHNPEDFKNVGFILSQCPQK